MYKNQGKSNIPYFFEQFMYTEWLPLLGGQSVPEGSRNPVVCV